jgi:hypothetical protein
MNSEGVSHEELVKIDKVEVEGKRKNTSKVVPDNKIGLKKNTTKPIEESKEHNSHFSEIFSLERPFLTKKNEKDRSFEKSKDDQKKIERSPQEFEDTVISKDKLNTNDKDSPDKEEEPEEYSKEEESEEKKMFEPFAQDEECYYLKLKFGDQFKLQESSYNLHTHNLCIGSKVRLVVGRNIVFNTKKDLSLKVVKEDEETFDWRETKIIDAVILPPLNRILDFWNGEREVFK